MKFKDLGLAILGGIIGSIILIGGIAGIDWLLTSRQTLDRGEGAIIREVWEKEGALWGPSSPPYRIRVVKNNSSKKIIFFIQPYPFGCVEEIVKKGEIKRFSFNLPLWTKDTITNNPNDASIARVLFADGQFKISNIKLYAENLDYRKLPYAHQGEELYEVKKFLLQRGREPEVSSREDLFSEIVYMDFSKFFSTAVDKMVNSIAPKYTLLAKPMREEGISSIEDKKKFIRNFLDKYPWYLLEPEYLEKLRENPEIQKLFQNYFEALRKKNKELINLNFKKIKNFFSRYMEENPASYDEEKWNYVKSLLLSANALPKEYKPEFMYPFVEKHIQGIYKNYTRKLHHDASTTYGVNIVKFKLNIKDDLTARYPYMLMKK